MRDRSEAPLPLLMPWPRAPTETPRTGRAFHAAREPARGRLFRSRPFVLAVGEIVHTAQVDQLFEAELRQVAQLARDLQPVDRLHFDRGLADIFDHVADAVAEMRAQLVGEGIFVLVGHANYFAIVCVRRIFFCNCRMPYTSASAVGGQPGT